MELTLDEALKRGVEAHKAGQLQEADRLYTAILQVAPTHPDANHNMGVLAVDVDKTEEALPFFYAAVEAGSNIAQFWLSYIDALLTLDSLDEARLALEQAKQKGLQGEAFDLIKIKLNELGANEPTSQSHQKPNSDGGKDLNIFDFKSIDQALRSARREIRGGEILEAKVIYQEILRIFPKNKKAIEGLKKLTIESANKSAKSQDPSQEKLQSIFNSYNIGELNQASSMAHIQLEQFPHSATLFNILGAINIGLEKIDSAIKCYEQALIIEPDFAEAYVNLGNVLQNKGDLNSAIKSYNDAIRIKPTLAEAYNNLGNALTSKADLGAAIKSYQQALKIKPDYAGAYINMGKALQYKGEWDAAIKSYKQALGNNGDDALAYSNMGNVQRAKGDLKAAIDSYNHALKINPDYAEAYNNLGNALRDSDDPNAAIDNYQKALNINPKYAIVYSNMGSVFQDMGKIDAAINSYSEALKINPDLAEAHANIGKSYWDKGELDASISSYKKALQARPDYALAYSNMGNVLKDKGDLDAAITSYQQAIKIKPDYADAYQNLGLALTDKVFLRPKPGLDNAIVSLLYHKAFVRPRNIAPAAISLLKFERTIQNGLERYIKGQLEEKLNETISDLSRVPLLLKLMSVCALPNFELEEFFTEIRSLVLFTLSSMTNSSEVLRFQSALALQCFTNEYIYNKSIKEVEALKVLEASVEENLLQGRKPSPIWVLCLASYKALHEYSWCHMLSFSAELQEVGKRQFLEPADEKRLNAEILVLKEITNSVSSKVRQQYEENPYPRWVNSWLAIKPLPISVIIKQTNIKLIDGAINEVRSPDILVAGCGTGQHSLAVASQYSRCKVLAVDLSLSSLAYAQRKTEELGVENVNYMQADILTLAKLNRQFDIIESVGVLHHMELPMAGWKVLTECLKPSGLMRIGLYSELAREDVVRVREEIIQSGICSSDVAMKLFRSDVVKSTQEHHKRIQSFEDFYSLSEFRDLLFHVQEHRFSLLQIKSCLAELGLEFCGFDHPEIVQNFGKSFKDPGDLYDLTKWDLFEKQNPRTFVGMYQFWCQKII